MDLDQLIELLQQKREELGKSVPVVSGITRHGYGEPVEDLKIVGVNKFGTSEYLVALDIVISDSTTVEMLDMFDPSEE